jgi:hypothetical protein
MARGILSLDSTETVGSNFSHFSLNFADGKQYKVYVGVALTLVWHHLAFA